MNLLKFHSFIILFLSSLTRWWERKKREFERHFCWIGSVILENPITGEKKFLLIRIYWVDPIITLMEVSFLKKKMLKK
jgi:hypothetical protein